MERPQQLYRLAGKPIPRHFSSGQRQQRFREEGIDWGGNARRRASPRHGSVQILDLGSPAP
jgi:hypothetical protein